MTEQHMNIVIKPDDAGLRIVKWFGQRYPEVNHASLQKHLRKGFIRVNEKKVKPDYTIKSGDIVRVHPVVLDEANRQNADKASDTAPVRKRMVNQSDLEMFRSSVIYNDEDMLAINKPAGLAVQGGTGIKMSLDDILDELAQVDEKERLRLVHHLDKDTSGVLLLAKTKAAAARLTKIFKEKEAQKIYWALVVGRPSTTEGKIDTLLEKKKNEQGDEVMMADAGGKRALTYYKVLDHVGDLLSWLALSPVTGRTHQLRVHCQSMGTPILGDGKYGGSKAFRDGMEKSLHLHARSITLLDAKEKAVTIDAALPDHMQRSWDMLGLDASRINTKFAFQKKA